MGTPKANALESTHRSLLFIGSNFYRFLKRQTERHVLVKDAMTRMMTVIYDIKKLINIENLEKNDSIKFCP
jgi:sulfur relay (sulfurtransferase) DsrF/TusC family protein